MGARFETPLRSPHRAHPTRAVFAPDHSNPANKNASSMPIWHGRGVLALVGLPDGDRPTFLF